MRSEEPKDRKNFGSPEPNEPTIGPFMQKRLPRKIRQIPNCYFLPRRSIPSAIAFCGLLIAAGVGTRMLIEIWINKKVEGVLVMDRYLHLRADGAIIWEFDK